MRRLTIFLLIVTILLTACGGSAGDASTSTPTADPFTELEREVAEQRQLALTDPVAMTLISGDAFADLSRAKLAEYYAGDKARTDAATYWLLGLVAERDLDLIAERGAYYDTLVGAVYDPTEHQLYIVRENAEAAEASLDPGGLSPLEKLLLWHEIVHSLQRQNFDIGDPGQWARQLTTDATWAYTSLVEGDARYWEIRYFTDEISRDEQNAIQEESRQRSLAVSERADALPDFLRALGSMPYIEGERLIEYAHTTGDVERINMLFEEPPVSSEQVLHPRKYWNEPDDLPVEIELEDLSLELGAGWSLTTDDVIGEWHLRYLLEHHGAGQTEFEALRGADGWGGDLLQLYENGNDALVILTTVWDTDEDAGEFQSAFAATLAGLEESAGIWQDGERYITVTSDGGAVTIISGTTDAVVSAATTAVSP